MEILTALEWIATVSGLVHVYLLTREKVVAWPFGVVTVALYAYIFFVSKLYSDAILHLAYIFINGYGWYNWSKRQAETDLVKISRLDAKGTVFLVVVILLGSWVWGYLMATQTDASFPYADAFTTVASLCAQYLLTKKKLENWTVWIAINLVAMPVYFLKGLYVTVGLYAAYLVLAVMGLMLWQRINRRQ